MVLRSLRCGLPYCGVSTLHVTVSFGFALMKLQYWDAAITNALSTGTHLCVVAVLGALRPPGTMPSMPVDPASSILVAML